MPDEIFESPTFDIALIMLQSKNVKSSEWAGIFKRAEIMYFSMLLTRLTIERVIEDREKARKEVPS